MTVELNSIQIRLTFPFVLIISLMLVLCRQEIVIICVAASLFHEAGHLLFMHIFGEKILSVSFGAFGVRIDRASASLLSYKAEVFIALGGIIINFLLAFLSIMYYYLMKSQVALMFSLINILIALFNCIPLYVLDMGRAVKSLLLMRFDEEKSEKLLRNISVIFVNLLAAGCCIYNAFVGVNVSLITVTVYLYVITLFKKWS